MPPRLAAGHWVTGHAEFGKLWSNNTQLFWNGNKQGDTLTLTLPAQKAGTYDLVGYFTKAGDYGQVSFTLNGKLLATTFDGYNDGVIPSGPVDLGIVSLCRTAPQRWSSPSPAKTRSPPARCSAWMRWPLIRWGPSPRLCRSRKSWSKDGTISDRAAKAFL